MAKKLLTSIFIVLLLLMGGSLNSLWAAGPSATSKPNAYSSNNQTINKPLEVRGQTRNLSMILTVSSKKDKIKFIKMRVNYRDEILRTQY